MDDIEIKNVIREEIKSIAFKTISDSEPLLSSSLLDSITVVDLAVSLEEKFNIKIPFVDIHAQHFDSVDLIAKYILLKSKSHS